MDERDFVADSEEEDNLMDTGMQKDPMNWQEEISTFGNGNGEERMPPQQLSSISDFTTRTDGGTASAIVSAFTTPSVKPRPRPRPILPKKKQAEGIDQKSSHISTFSDSREQAQESASRQATNGTAQLDGMEVTASIADRAKTRERRKLKPSSETQWDDGDGEPFLPESKKKAKSVSEPDYVPGGEPSSTKSRGKKDKDKARQLSDVIDISDDDDELNLKRSAPKPKGAPTPSVTSSLLPTELIPTEPIIKPRPKPRPVPKKPKPNLEGQPENPVLDNRASTPAHPPPDTDLLSSNSRGHRNPLIPSSLPPSDPPIPTVLTEAYSFGVPAIETLAQPSSSNLGHKAQREFDELFSGDEDLFGPELVPPVDPKGLPPPPTFFAGSSSQVKGDEGVPSMGQEGEGLNVTTLSAQPQDDPKPKAKKKQKAAEEDGDDGEWGAAPPKPKEKKTSKKKAFSEVEVVITRKPPGKGKRDKEKKKKDEGSSSRKGEKTKEVFKSREMIEDSDEDPLLESYRPEEEAMGVPPLGSPPGYKGKPFDRSKDPVTMLEEELGMVEDDAGPAAKKSSKRKRKSMVVEDDDEFDEGLSKIEESSNKRQKKEKKGKGEAAGGGQNTNPANPGSKKQKGKAKAVIISEDEEELAISKTATSAKVVAHEEPVLSKEHVEPARPERFESPRTRPVEQATQKPPIERPRQPRLSIGSRAKATPMSELIKRVNSLPNSPFPPATSSRLPTISRIATSYSPYLKASRSMLSRIAPLHPNRRTPPPPLPPPPPRKKTKKEIEREEKWEEELIDSLGGLEAWIALSDTERRDMRKAKFDMEMGGWDD